MFGYWTVFLIALITVVKSDDECDPEQAGCDFDIELALSTVKGFPSADFLNEYCSPMVKSANCKRNYFERCGYPVDIEPELVERALGLLASVCDENADIRKGYLANVDCYESSMTEIVGCVLQTTLVITGFVEEHENMTEFQHGDLEGCLGMPLLFGCIVKEVSNKCGEDETDPLAEFVASFTNIFMDAQCPEDLMPVWEAEFVSYLRELEEDRKKK